MNRESPELMTDEELEDELVELLEKAVQKYEEEVKAQKRKELEGQVRELRAYLSPYNRSPNFPVALQRELHKRGMFGATRFVHEGWKDGRS